MNDMKTKHWNNDKELFTNICDGFRALAAVSPGCLATVVKSHRTWIPMLRFHPPA